MPITASQFQQNVYRTLDEILETGAPVEIEHKGRILRITLDAPWGKLANLKRRDGVVLCDLEDLVHMDWSTEWKAVD